MRCTTLFPVAIQNESKSYADLNTSSSSSYMSRTNGNPRIPSSDGYLTSLPRPPHKNTALLENSSASDFDPKVLDYADALLQARDLARSAGIRCSSTPLASSVMKGVKVLARLDRDGLFYLGNVKEQVS
jgi:hypothetical protein